VDFTADSRLDWVRQFAAWALPVPTVTPFVGDASPWLKLETAQIAGSAKYRVVHGLLCSALLEDRIHQGTILTAVGATSLARSLAYAGKLLGLKVELHAPAELPAPARRALSATGARIVAHPGERSPEDLLAEVRRRAERHGHWLLDPADPVPFADAYESLAQELLIQIFRACRKAPRTLVCPIKSGRLLWRVGRRLKQALPNLRTVGVTFGPRPARPCGAIDHIEQVERETRPMRRNGHSLGLGGTACYRLVRRREWKDVVILAPG
jgi:cysteine synthase